MRIEKSTNPGWYIATEKGFVGAGTSHYKAIKRMFEILKWQNIGNWTKVEKPKQKSFLRKLWNTLTISSI